MNTYVFYSDLFVLTKKKETFENFNGQFQSENKSYFYSMYYNPVLIDDTLTHQGQQKGQK
jgi:hypothetical protein